MKQTAKVTARGFYKGKPTVVEVIEYDGGYDKNGDEKKGKLLFFKDGTKFKFKSSKIPSFDWSFDDEDSVFMHDLSLGIVRRHYELRGAHAYNPPPDMIEAYWLAFNHGDGFDEVPEIEVEGDIYTFGSPFTDEDTSGVVF